MYKYVLLTLREEFVDAICWLVVNARVSLFKRSFEFFRDIVLEKYRNAG